MPKIPDLKNYLIWTGLTDSEQKKLWDPANAYFSIWGISPGWLEKFDQLQRVQTISKLVETTDNIEYINLACRN